MEPWLFSTWTILVTEPLPLLLSVTVRVTSMSPNSLKVNLGFCSVTVLEPIFHSHATMVPSGSDDLSVNCTSSPALMPEEGEYVKSATGRLLVS